MDLTFVKGFQKIILFENVKKPRAALIALGFRGFTIHNLNYYAVGLFGLLHGSLLIWYILQIIITQKLVSK